MRSLSLAALAVALAGAGASCTGAVGVVSIELVEAPGGAVLASTERVRLVLDNPPTVAEATRAPGGGLALSLELPATDSIGRLTLEAFDGAGALIGVAESGPLPLGAIDGLLTLYVAAPNSIGAATIALEPPRADIAVAPLSFGAILIGGVDASGAPVDDVCVYNLYDHAFQVGADLERPRSGAAAVAGERGVVYLFGGNDGAQDIAAPLGFDTNVAPAGSYFELEGAAGLERGNARGASIGGEDVIIAGDPAIRLDGFARTATALSGGPALAGTLTTSRTLDATESTTIALAVGEGTGTTGAAQVGSVSAVALDGPAELVRTGHVADAAPGGDIYIAGGTDMAGDPLLSGLRYRGASGDFVVLPDLLTGARIDAALAVTDKHIVIAGGTDETGDVLADVVVLDLASLETVATLPMVVGRTGAHAVAMSNGQVLIVGGRDQAGGVIATIEIFTPSL